MQINSIGKSTNFNAWLAPKLQSTIDRRYSRLQKIFSHEYKDIIGRLTSPNFAPNDILNQDSHGNIFISVKENRGYSKKIVAQAKFDYRSGVFYIDSEIVDEIINNVNNKVYQ